MAHVTGTLQSGVYVITNVASNDYATLSDDNKGSEIEIKATKNGRYYDLTYWTITRLSNHYYTIMAHGHATYAKVTANPREGVPVVGSSDKYQWDIPETYEKGEYVITPSSNDMLYWYLVKSDPAMTVKLISGFLHGTTWKFTRAADYVPITDND